MWPPKIEARVLQDLAVKKTDKVLEVGTGSGYFTALLAHQAQHVYSIEINAELKTSAEANLRRAGVGNATVELGDAAHGWSKHAPYDVIVLTGSTPELPPQLLQQLQPSGRLFAVVGSPPVMTARLVTCTGEAAYASRDLLETRVAPLKNASAGERFRF